MPPSSQSLLEEGCRLSYGAIMSRGAILVRQSRRTVPPFPLRETVPWTRLLVLYGYLAEELERRPLYISIWISYDRVKTSWKWITNFEANFLTILIGVESILDMVKKWIETTRDRTIKKKKKRKGNNKGI